MDAIRGESVTTSRSMGSENDPGGRATRRCRGNQGIQGGWPSLRRVGAQSPEKRPCATKKCAREKEMRSCKTEMPACPT